MARFLLFTRSRLAADEFRRDFPEHAFIVVSDTRVTRDQHVIATTNLSAVCDQLAEMHRADPFLGVICGEHQVRVAARVAEALGLPRFIDDPEKARDKYSMRLALAPVVKCPDAQLLTCLEDVRRLGGVTFPRVLKPRHGYGSICVVKVHDRQELVQAFTRTQAMLRHLARTAPLAFASGDCLLEEFVGGTEHTVETFVVDSQVAFHLLSDKMPMTPPYFIEVGDIMPSLLPPAAQQAICRTVEASIRTLGIRHGWTHTEIKLWNGVPYLMEIAARQGGGYTGQMVRCAYGIDIRKVLIDSYLGRRPAPPTETPRAVVGRNVVCYGVTFIWKVDGLEECRARTGHQESVQKLAGRMPKLFLGPPFSYDNTLMAYLSVASSSEGARALAAETERTLQILRASFFRNSRNLYRLFLRLLELRALTRRLP